jgi:N-acetylglucosamine kinase-like BadF-type ATPase
MRTILAVDGGNSKTDVALFSDDGRLLAAARGSTVSHQVIGLEAAIRRIIDQASGVLADSSIQGPVDVAALALAGADTAADVRRLQAAIASTRIARLDLIRNDAEAVLRAGTDRGWGVAVICGSGVGAIGVAPDGRRARLDALGPISGDWGGGTDVGWAGLAAAVRARDGRGRPSRLAVDVPAHFGLRTPAALTTALYRGRVGESRLGELAPVVFAAAQSGDAVAREIVDKLADEVVAMTRSMIVRLRMRRLDPDVILGGGVFRTQEPGFVARIEAGIAALAPRSTVRRLAVPPVAGAALLGLDALGADGVGTSVRAALATWDRDLLIKPVG